MVDDRDRVLGDFREEMQRRAALARQYQMKDLTRRAAAFVLIGFGVWPLGFWHALAVIIGVYFVLILSEENTYRLADELDLLEQKVVAIAPRQN